MKIFILNPNFNDEKKSLINVRARQPLELAYIASILIKEGQAIKLLDANVLNLAQDEVIREINDYRADIFICTTTPIDRWECPNSHINGIFEILNKVRSKTKIILGSHGTTMPEWIFKNCDVDYIVRSEPELIVKELINQINENKPLTVIKGISYKDNEKIIHNQPAERIKDLDSLPFPAYNLLPMKKYHNPAYPDPFTIMMTSRGCLFSCIFCLKAMLPDFYIVRSPQNVIAEIEHLVNNFRIKSIYFQDWEFLIDAKRVAEICDLIIGKKINFFWGCNARATDITQNPNLIKKMKEAGCFKINLGLESASDKILSNIDKKIKKEDLKKAIKILKENDLEIGFYVLLNCPGENKTTIKETIDFIIENNIKVKNFNPIIPYPGTILFERLKKQYPNQNFDWDNIEDYAGRIEVEMNPSKVLFYLRHYKYKKLFSRFYFFNPLFWRSLFIKNL